MAVKIKDGVRVAEGQDLPDARTAEPAEVGVNQGIGSSEPLPMVVVGGVRYAPSDVPEGAQPDDPNAEADGEPEDDTEAKGARRGRRGTAGDAGGPGDPAGA